ncbi:hypothetical protein PC116_g19344 [Phytophthora cactorum]|nr:hypothetical protein PC116_g19344 [Phytophthora cactorum]
MWHTSCSSGLLADGGENACKIPAAKTLWFGRSAALHKLDRSTTTEPTGRSALFVVSQCRRVLPRRLYTLTISEHDLFALLVEFYRLSGSLSCRTAKGRIWSPSVDDVKVVCSDRSKYHSIGNFVAHALHSSAFSSSGSSSLKLRRWLGGALHVEKCVEVKAGSFVTRRRQAPSVL